MDDETRIQEAQEWLDYFSDMSYNLKEWHKSHPSFTQAKGHKTGDREFSAYELAELIVMCRCIIGDKRIEDFLDTKYIKAVSKVNVG